MSYADQEPRRCKECPAGSKRPAPHKGPRCATHHRAYQDAAKRRGHEHHIRALFSLTADDYDRLRAAQGGRCAICQRSTGRSKRLPVDHNHATREIRGLLCQPCNKFVGWVRDDPEAFARGYTYLTDPPARAALGARRYTDDGYRAGP